MTIEVAERFDETPRAGRRTAAVSEIVRLESIRDCLRAGLPCPLATCSPYGMPNIGYISQVRYLDQERVATSRQFFNRALPAPVSQALITRPTTGEQFRLDLRYLHTTSEGEEFEATRLQLALGRRTHQPRAASCTPTSC